MSVLSTGNSGDSTKDGTSVLKQNEPGGQKSFGEWAEKGEGGRGEVGLGEN